MVWRMIKSYVPMLGNDFRRLYTELKGEHEARAETCYSYASKILSNLLGALFIRKRFSANVKSDVSIPYYTTPHHSTPHPKHNVPYHTIPYHTIPYHTIPYHTIPYHTIPYHTIPYHYNPIYTTPHPTTLHHSTPQPNNAIPDHTMCVRVSAVS